MRLSQAIIAGGPLPHLTPFHEILTNILAALLTTQNVREDLVKWCEPGMSLVCYHCRRERGKCSVSLFLWLPENSDTADSRAERHSHRKGDRRAALYGR